MELTRRLALLVGGRMVLAYWKKLTASVLFE